MKNRNHKEFGIGDIHYDADTSTAYILKDITNGKLNWEIVAQADWNISLEAFLGAVNRSKAIIMPTKID